MSKPQRAPDTQELPWNTIGLMLQNRFEESADREALVDGEVRLSYRELGDTVRTLAAALQSHGFRSGDVVVLWGPNCWQWVASALACWWLGGVVAPVSARNRGLETLAVLQSTSARYLFAASRAGGTDLFQSLLGHIGDRGLAPAEAMPDLKLAVNFDGDSDLDFADSFDNVLARGSAGDAEQPALVSGDDTCTILFTSGTTGHAKGVMRGHEQTLKFRWISSRTRGYGSEDRVLVIPPFSHVSGLNNGLLRCLIMGMTCIVMRHYDPAAAIKLLPRESVTVLAGPPSLFTQLLVEERVTGGILGQLRLASVGAAPCPPSLIHALREHGVGQICSSYGLTEFEGACETSATDSPDTIAHTVGKPTFGVHLKLVGKNGQEVAPGDVGEILLKGYNLMRGYFQNEEATRQVVDPEGYLATGDLGRFNEEGNLQIVGRKKDMIIVHGINLYPAEVEHQLMQSELLAEVAVVGRPNRLAGEECIAFILPKATGSFALRDLTRWARKNMAAHKVPARYIVLEQMPLNANGKIDRLALRRQLD